MILQWRKISEEMPPEKTEVALCWTWPDVPDSKTIIRLGTLLYKPWPTDQPIFKLELDFGDSGAWVYTPKEDAPTHWAYIQAPEY